MDRRNVQTLTKKGPTPVFQLLVFLTPTNVVEKEDLVKKARQLLQAQFISCKEKISSTGTGVLSNLYQLVYLCTCFPGYCRSPAHPSLQLNSIGSSVEEEL